MLTKRESEQLCSYPQFLVNQPAEIKNPYLEEFLAEGEKQSINVESYFIRERLVKKYAWAIPDTLSINLIAQYSPLIEIGAGTGYWASLISQAGGNIICYDEYIPGEEKGWFPETKPFYPIEYGKADKVEENPDRTLFLCWPPYQNSLAFDCLYFYKGKFLIYVGEGPWGCNGCDDFHEEISNNWEEVTSYCIHKWNWIHDKLFVFKRK